VLRRQTERLGDLEREASVMRYARAQGYPVPRVVAVRREGLVLELIIGPTMFADIGRRPWRMREHVRTLAALHRRLHLIGAPPGLPHAGEGTQLIHLDFHPENILLSPAGPVVIDWTNARCGDPALDVAMTWVIGATSAGQLGRLLTRWYLAEQDLARVRAALPLAAERRIADPNVTDGERARVRRLVARHSA
jgi:aminoglycoside phosphotransferase (APT) family kinase protein